MVFVILVVLLILNVNESVIVGGCVCLRACVRV